jgi:hypothetical protein
LTFANIGSELRPFVDGGNTAETPKGFQTINLTIEVRFPQDFCYKIGTRHGRDDFQDLCPKVARSPIQFSIVVAKDVGLKYGKVTPVDVTGLTAYPTQLTLVNEEKHVCNIGGTVLELFA